MVNDPKGEVYDWDAMAARCAAEAPFWEPGTRQGYHMLSFGWLIGEVVRNFPIRQPLLWL